jgi:hypothetical protein
MTIVTALSDLFIAALFGGMVLFAAVVAPRVFMVLKPDTAGRFLRALFPWYYTYLIITAGIPALLVSGQDPAQAIILGAIALSTLAVRQVLMPRINRWRDAELAGDASAGAKFNLGHRVSVIVNVVQLVLAGSVLVARSINAA